MTETEPNDATPFLPEKKTLTALREAAAGCRGRPLWRNATQTVFGEGLKKSRLMLVREVPGDREDREGKPFVGPAGRELDRALEAAARRCSGRSSSSGVARAFARLRPGADRDRHVAELLNP